MWTLPVLSSCGWAFSSVTRPWVAQRVWAMPVSAGIRLPLPFDATSTAARRLARLPTAWTDSTSPFASMLMPAES